MIRRPPRSTQSRSSAASDVYKRQELFLDIKNFSSVLRKSKYLATTRNNDKKALEQYTNTVSELELVEAELEDNKAQLELKRASREEEKSELGETINTLDSQKKEREKLLAESKIKEAQLPVSYTHLRAHETVLDIVCRLLLEKKKKYRTY